MREHPTASDLEAFLMGRLSAAKSQDLIRHLVHGCFACAAELRKGQARLALRRRPELPVADDAYSKALKRAERMARHLTREVARAREITPMLIHAGLMSVVQEADLPLSGFAMYLALLDASWAMRYENPREMVCLARAAVEVAGKLNPKRYGAERICDLKARAWGELANALRVADDLDESERAFGVAFEFLRHGTEDSYLKVRLYDLHASFLGTRRRFLLAFSTLDIVVAIYRDLGERHLAGRALIIKAMYSHYNGQSEEAIRLSQEGIPFLDKDREPELAFFAAHNRIVFLMACGRFREAKKELFLNQAEFQKVEGRVNHLKLRWVQAQVSAGLEEWKSAEVALLEVRDGFEAADMRFHAALASLDLSLLWMRRERWRDAEVLGREAVDVFLSLGIQREALGCVMILKDAFEKRRATVVLLESVVDFLRRTQIDPDAYFTPRFE